MISSGRSMCEAVQMALPPITKSPSPTIATGSRSVSLSASAAPTACPGPAPTPAPPLEPKKSSGPRMVMQSPGQPSGMLTRLTSSRPEWN